MTASTTYGSKLQSSWGWGYRNKYRGTRFSSLTENPISRDTFIPFKDFWLGYTNRALKIWDGLSWVTLATANSITLPYLTQSDSTTQGISVINTPQVLTFNTSIYASGITKTSSSRFTVTISGAYLIIFNGIADLTGGANKHIEVWIRVDGIDVPASNTRIEIPSANVEMTVAVSFIYFFRENQYFELWTAGDSTSCRWLATAAGSTAGGVACPSIIMTCNKISN
jgi:hypothetical protein